MKLKAIPILLLLLMTMGARGALLSQIYVAPTTQGSGVGTSEANAMTMANALDNIALNGTIIPLPGTYSNTPVGVYQHGVTIRAKIRHTAIFYGPAASHTLFTYDNYTNVVFDGLVVGASYIDCAKLNGDGGQVINCILLNAGRGDAGWGTNTNGAYSGQGVSIQGKNNCVVSNNIIAFCGAYLNKDHGGYIAGTTNTVFVNNWIFNCLCWGVQFYDADWKTKNLTCYGNTIWGNGNVAGSPGGALTIWSTNSDNRIYNNTLSGAYAIIVDKGSPQITNNILDSIVASNPIITTNNSATPSLAYNLRTSNTNGGAIGGTDVVVADLKLVNIAQGRLWPAWDSPARGMALTTLFGTNDPFGRSLTRIRDVGAHQFSHELGLDTRNLSLATNVGAAKLFPPVSFYIDGYGTNHTLRWLNSSFANGIQVWRKAGAGGSYAKIADLASTDEVYQDPVGPLTEGTTYYYKLASTNAWGLSPWSHELDIICDKTSAIHPSRLPYGGLTTSNTGLETGDIPTRPIWADISVNIPGTNIVAVGDGSTDNLAAFAAACALCPTNQRVYIGTPGVYLCSATFGFFANSQTANSYRTFSGISSNSVVIKPTAGFSGQAMFQIGNFIEQGTERIISGANGLAKGATQVTLPGGLGVIPIVVGTPIKIWERRSNQQEGATGAGGNADPNYYSNDSSSMVEAGAPLVRDIVTVTAISGNTLTFSPPLKRAYSAEAMVQYQYQTLANYSGLTDVTIDLTGSTVSKGVIAEGGSQNFIRRVHTKMAVNAHLRVQFADRFLVDECFFEETPDYGPNKGIGIQMLRDVDGAMIRGTIFKGSFPAIEYQNSCDWNFVTRCLMIDPKGGVAPIDNHGGLNEGNVFEGVRTPGVILDGYFGGALRWTFFRCNVHGNNPPWGARKAFAVKRFNRLFAVLDSVVGWGGTNWIDEKWQSGWSNSDAVLAQWGYPQMGNDTYPGGTNSTFRVTNINAIDIGVKSNLVWHGNYVYSTPNRIVYDTDNAARAYPYSLFAPWNTSVAPAWYQATWPGIGTDGGVLKNDLIAAELYYYGIPAPTPDVIPSGLYNCCPK